MDNYLNLGSIDALIRQSLDQLSFRFNQICSHPFLINLNRADATMDGNATISQSAQNEPDWLAGGSTVSDQLMAVMVVMGYQLYQPC